MTPLWMMRMRTNRISKRNPPDLSLYATRVNAPDGKFEFTCRECGHITCWPIKWAVTADEITHFIDEHHRSNHMKRIKRIRMPDLEGFGDIIDFLLGR